VASLSDLARAHGDLDDRDVAHLHGLVGEWATLADLSFADLLLLLPDAREPSAWVCVAQVRPSTGPTMYGEDLVGRRLPAAGTEAVAVAATEGRIVREGEPVWRDDVPVREEAIPVRRGVDGPVVAVLARHTNVAALRTPSALELAYLAAASDLAQMVAEGRFPFPLDPATSGLPGAPRVGDGLVRLDEAGTVAYASPNAQSALRRLGHAGNLTGADLAALLTGLALEPAEPSEPGEQPPRADALLVTALEGKRPAEVELVGGGTDAAVRLRAVPLLPGGRLLGALVLVRDVTEVRHRDRQLLTKDATIREIHHRVKNNLQTVAALLRLQARRTTLPEARFALEESVRRVTSIAVVHETLSQALDETVAFDGIADTVVALSLDVATTAPGARHAAVREGSFGVLPATVATPLALVLSELVSNAVEHAYGGSGGRVVLRVRRSSAGLEVVVADSGRGLPAGALAGAAGAAGAGAGSGGLGLQIVRTLAVGEMRGTFALRAGADGGTEAVVAVPAAVL